MRQKHSYQTYREMYAVDGQAVRGVVFRPDRAGRMPLVICSHGFGSSHRRLARYGDALARHGLAAFMLDFRGGSVESISDGKTTDMTVLTEVQDIQTAVEEVRRWGFVDPEQIVLLGTSQGGLASALAAARILPAVRALVLIYPAFMLPDDVHREFSSLESIPDTVFYRSIMSVGRKYFEVLWDLDVYGQAAAYAGPVLIIQGTKDDVVPPEYSVRAARIYENAELNFVAGGRHAFEGEAMTEAILDTVRFLRSIGVIEAH